MRKAINIDKQPVLWISFYHGLDGLDGLCGFCPIGIVRDQKVCCFPQAYAFTARCVCSVM